MGGAPAVQGSPPLLQVPHNEFVGNAGFAVFYQDSGTHQIAGHLYVAKTGQASYTLNGGVLNTTGETIGAGRPLLVLSARSPSPGGPTL